MPTDTMVLERPTGSNTQVSETQSSSLPSGPDWYLRETPHLLAIAPHGTGSDTARSPHVMQLVTCSTIPEALLSDSTGLAWLAKSLLHVFLAYRDYRGQVLTDHGPDIQVEEPQTGRTSRPAKQRLPDDPSVAAATPAARLRELTRLDATRLGDIFDVSRVTYQQWVRNGTPHGGNGERLLEVLALVEDAAQRLGSPTAVREWLLTPTSAGGKKPLELLTERRDHAFRGHLLRIESRKQRARPLPPSGRAWRPLSQEAFEDALERLRPRIRREEDSADRETVTSRFMHEQEG